MEVSFYLTVRNRDDDTPGYYYVGEQRHVNVALPLQFVLAILKESGFAVKKKKEMPFIQLQRQIWSPQHLLLQ